MNLDPKPNPKRISGAQSEEKFGSVIGKRNLENQSERYSWNPQSEEKIGNVIGRQSRKPNRKKKSEAQLGEKFGGLIGTDIQKQNPATPNFHPNGSSASSSLPNGLQMPHNTPLFGVSLWDHCSKVFRLRTSV